MYEAFFGLREKPFNLTPDPRFLFLSEKHKEAFAHLLYGIKNRGGFVMVTGEIGTGKTTICRTLLGKLEDDTEVAFIFNPCMSPEELLRTINEDFGIHSRAGSVKGLIDELNTYLLDRKTRGKNCVIVIDEAQNLTPQVLEQIRLLSNLETEQEKLLQIVLIGQPELAEHLELHELRQLDQRITARYHLRELDRDETLQYIAYRLRVAGGRGRIRFTRGAVRAVYRYSGGVPRMINAICDRALLVGYTQESRDVTTAIVRRAAREVRGERLGKPAKRAWSKVLRPVAAMLLLALVLGGGYWSFPFVVQQWTALQEAQASKMDQRVKPLSEDTATPPAPLAAPSLTPAAAVEPSPGAKTAVPPTEKPVATTHSVAESEAILDRLEAVPSRDAATATVFRMWGVTPQGKIRSNDLQGLIDYFAANGLSAETLSPTLNQLLAIDLPALATILGKDFEPMWVGVVGRQGDDVVIATSPETTAVIAKAAFEKRYTIQAVVPWRDEHPVKGLLQEAMQGDAVAALQGRLAALGRLTGAPTGVYDAATVTAVRLVQHETGLTVDGKVGRQTRMVLTSWDDSVSAPSLKAGPPPVEKPAEEAPPAEPTESVVASAPAQDGPVAPVEQAPSGEAESKAQEAAKPADPPVEAPAPTVEAPKPAVDGATPPPADATKAERAPEPEPPASPSPEPVETHADPVAPEDGAEEPVPAPTASATEPRGAMASSGGPQSEAGFPGLDLGGFAMFDVKAVTQASTPGRFVLRDNWDSIAVGHAEPVEADGTAAASE